VAACVAPRAPVLTGTPVARTIPVARLPAGHWQINFTWQLDDPEMSGSGEGVARIATPDSVRLDFFIAGGFAGGAAVMIGDSLRLPGTDFARRLVPPAPLLWAALGRTALPAVPDTVAREDGALLRADLGRPTEWRLTFRNESLVHVDRISGGRVVEWVDRTDLTRVRYRNETARRTLTLALKTPERVMEFDAQIWTFAR
jgi:hypothetical protein